MNEKIKVSVFCLAYNHEKYIRNALEGFVKQKTNFAYEVLIHDDASTDNTAKIIKEYEEKYPNIIKPIYQTENQYSQGIKISKKYILPRAKGKYFAWCEGDDYWTDPLKLQKQVDFLENNPEYSTCAHRVKMITIDNGWEAIIPKIDEAKEFSVDEIIRGGALFQMSSLVMRKCVYEKKPSCFSAKGFGDIQLYIHGAASGKFMVLGDVMSVYNHGTEGSWTKRTKGITDAEVLHTSEKIKMFTVMNEYYEKKYDQSIQYALNREYFNLAKHRGAKKEMRKPEYREFYNKYRKEKVKAFLRNVFPWLSAVRKFFGVR
ncbi:MAG: glycosyltransferase family 2 protein [Ruminococcaceae bacterium]|nr:glycosyltransferase family 2 protein [Oscillospiraceae bacterium]